MRAASQDGIETPAPRANLLLLGHEEVERRIETWITGDCLPHALLLCGPWGIGKATLAFHIARRLLGSNARGREPARPSVLRPRLSQEAMEGDGFDQAARWIASGTHPDLLTIERGLDEKRGRTLSEIVIGDVRKIGAFLASSPALGGWRVVIIDSADEMNRNAANALLKVLEEPAAKSLLLLVAHQPGLVPATVRSRCRKLLLAPLNDEVLGELMGRLAPDLPVEDAAVLNALAEGSIGRMLQLARHDGVTVHKAMRGFFLSLLDKEKGASRAVMAQSRSATDEEAFRVAMHVLFWWLRHIIRAVLTEQPTSEALPGVPAEEGTNIRRLAAAAALDHWLKVWDKAHHLATQADTGTLDRRQVLMTVLLNVQRELQSARP